MRVVAKWEEAIFKFEMTHTEINELVDVLFYIPSSRLSTAIAVLRSQLSALLHEDE